jgi:uncharacterized protein
MFRKLPAAGDSMAVGLPPRLPDQPMTARTLAAFFALTFGLSWGTLGLFLAFEAEAEALFGTLGYTHPLFILAVYAPALSALFLVWRHHGLAGLGRFARRLTLWRMAWPWWGFIVLGIPAVAHVGAALKGTLEAPLPFLPWPALLSALAITLAIGPMEELGWRGLALPLMQRWLAPFCAGFGLGVVWAVWHVPAFFMGGTPQSQWSLPGFLIGCVALSLILTPMINASRGSLLVAVLFHFQVNNPLWPDAQPWDSMILAVLAAVLVVAQRKHYFNPAAGATEVLWPAAASRDAADKPL